MKKYYYFVSYVLLDPMGFGCCTIKKTTPVTSADSINSLRNVIRALNGRDDVVILNYQLLRVEDESLEES